jgi:hypothetical protein
MPGLDPGIHVLETGSDPEGEDVDGRVKPGHDVLSLGIDS